MIPSTIANNHVCSRCMRCDLRANIMLTLIYLLVNALLEPIKFVLAESRRVYFWIQVTLDTNVGFSLHAAKKS